MANEAAGSAIVVIDGQRYERFTALRLKRSREEATCSGTLVLSWPGLDGASTTSLLAPAFVDGADCQIILDGQLAATATLDVRSSKGSPKTYELTLHFRGQMSEHVDSSPRHETGQENRKSAVEIMKKLMEGGKGQLIDKTTGTPKQMERFIIAEGESIERACRRVAREFGMNFFENPEGNWVLTDMQTQSGAAQADLRLGRQFTNWTTKRDIGPRFKTCGVAASGIPTDKNYGKVCEGLFAQDFRQIPGAKELRGLVDGDHTKDSLGIRAALEGVRRSSQGLNVTLTMSTWSDDGNNLWAVDNTYHVVIPVDQIDEDMKLSEVEFELTADSRTASLTLISKGDPSGGDVMFDKQDQPAYWPPTPQNMTPPPPAPSETPSTGQ